MNNKDIAMYMPKRCENFTFCQGNGHTDTGKSRHLLTKNCPMNKQGSLNSHDNSHHNQNQNFNDEHEKREMETFRDSLQNPNTRFSHTSSRNNLLLK